MSLVSEDITSSLRDDGISHRPADKAHHPKPVSSTSRPDGSSHTDSDLTDFNANRRPIPTTPTKVFLPSDKSIQTQACARRAPSVGAILSAPGTCDVPRTNPRPPLQPSPNHVDTLIPYPINSRLSRAAVGSCQGKPANASFTPATAHTKPEHLTGQNSSEGATSNDRKVYLKSSPGLINTEENQKSSTARTSGKDQDKPQSHNTDQAVSLSSSPGRATPSSSPVNQQTTSTGVVKPPKFFSRLREVPQNANTVSASNTSGSSGGAAKTWSRLKSSFTLPNRSKGSGRSDTTNNGTSGNKSQKTATALKRSGNSDSEATPLFPDNHRQPRREEQRTLETMTEKLEEGSRFFVYYLSCFATIGGLLFGYDTGIVSGSMLLIEDYFDLSTIWKELIVSGTVGAAAVFALVAGFVCDYMGRKVSIMLASIVFAGGAVVMGAADSKEMLLGGRIIVGIGIGFASMTVPVYVAEAAPTAIRGRLVTLNQLFITIGILVSSLVAGGFSSMKETGWRYMLGLAAVPGIIQFVGFLYLPESPRWLLTKGREEQAKAVLQRIRAKEDVEDELEEIRAAVAESQKQSGFVLGRVLRTAHVRRALFVGCGLQVFQQLCGINTVIYYSGTILKMAGFPAKQAIWLVTIPFSINFLFTILGVVLVERLGRKRLLLASFVGVTVALIVLAVGFQLSYEFSPAIDRNITEAYSNGTFVTDDCVAKQFATCEECITEKHCGFCYSGIGDSDGGTCLRADEAGDKEDEQAVYGRCDSTNLDKLDTSWAHGYCPTDYTWMAVLGLTLFVMAFAPGLGPMPWTINSEIYPLWARGTGNALATGCNWICNLVVSLFFLTLTETITKHGAFWMFGGICFLGLLFTAVFVPETKNKTLEEMEQLFQGRSNPSVGVTNKGYEREVTDPEQPRPAAEKKEDTKF